MQVGTLKVCFCIVYRILLFTQLCIEFSVGNRYYERPSPNGIRSSPAFWRGVLTYFHVDSTRTARRIEYRDPEDVWKYTGGGKRLPSASHYYHHLYLVNLYKKWNSPVVCMADSYTSSSTNNRGSPFSFLILENRI